MHTALISDTANGIPFLRFPHLSDIPGLRHGVFTRHGGVSPPPYESLNLGLGGSDLPENIAENQKRAARCVLADRLFFARQVHGTTVIEIGDSLPSPPPDGDALITNRPGICIAVQVADCQPVLLFDPQKRAVAAVHSGWRGSVENVIGHTIAAMESAYGTRPGDLLAGIGPSLGPCCGEFIHYREELPERLWKYGAENNRFDFWAISRDQLTAGGVQKENIRTAGICTRCRSDLFFSYRGERETGRFAAAIKLE